MANNSRVSIAFDNDLMLIWNKVAGVSAYKFSIFRKDSLEFIGGFEVDKEIVGGPEDEPLANPPGYRCDENYCTSSYPPELKLLLEPQIPYLLIGETLGGDTIQRIQAEFLILEKQAQEAYKAFENELGPAAKSFPKLKSTWDEALEVICFSPFAEVARAAPLAGAPLKVAAKTPPPPKWPKGSCHRVRFS